MPHIKNKKSNIIHKKTDEKRLRELLKQKEDLESTRPHDVESMRGWKHKMGKILEEIELFKKN